MHPHHRSHHQMHGSGLYAQAGPPQHAPPSLPGRHVVQHSSVGPAYHHMSPPLPSRSTTALQSHRSPPSVRPQSSSASGPIASSSGRRLSYAEEGSSAGDQPAKRPRTARACLRCRAQKLKCSGEIPCQRCTRLSVTCRDALATASDPDYGRERQSVHTLAPLQPLSTTERQLHSALRRITHLEASVDSIQHRLSLASGSFGSSSSVSGLPGDPGSAEYPPAGAATAPPPSVSQFPAPFSDVAYDKKMLENRQETRANSPAEDEPTPSRPASSVQDALQGYGVAGMQSEASATKTRKMGTLGSPWDHPLDPITAGIMSVERASKLISFFFNNCHAYCPLFDTRRLPTLDGMRRTDLFLLCAILAIAARYAEMSEPSHSALQAEVEREDICQVAEAHMGRTLVIPRHRLGDVQAIVLLHAYSLRSGGSGHDPWILSGHAFRLAKRLSIDRIVTLQPGQSKISNSTSMLRRTWLLLCASDCFPSLGFGRPASPRENLDSCAPVLNLLAERYARRSENGGDDDLDDAEFFIASQVELASISRHLLDWVAQTSLPLSRSSDLRAVAHKYDMLVDQLDTCQARWNGPELGTPEQWRMSRLFRLHVRLCLATFTMRLGETALSNGEQSSAKRRRDGEKHSAQVAISSGPAASTARRKSLDPISSDRTREIADRLQVDCRRACIDAAMEMVSIHRDEALTYVPDYLVTALAQAIITSIGILETQQRMGQIEREAAVTQAQTFVDDARQTLTNFTTNQTGLADFLLDKVLDRARRSSLLDSGDVKRHTTGQRASYENHGSPIAYGADGSYQTDYPPSWRSHIGPPQRTPMIEADLPSHMLQARQRHAGGTMSNSGSPAANNVNPGTPGANQISEMDLLLAGGLPGQTGSAADGVLQWGGLPQWWNGDDPLQLLFGIGTGDAQWPRADESINGGMTNPTLDGSTSSSVGVGGPGSDASPGFMSNAGASTSDQQSPHNLIPSTTAATSTTNNNNNNNYRWQRPAQAPT